MSDDIPGGRKITSDLTFMPGGGFMAKWSSQVGKGTNALTGEQGVILVITEHDGTLRHYIMPPEEARKLAAQLVERANQITSLELG